ncbi:MAG: hypothetical protein OXI92_06950, partial [Acidobacteriota bacterium]|nr:hypothetical protein [Acidobacteriota bacterium]
MILRPEYQSLARILATLLICLGWNSGWARGQETAVPPTLLSLRIVPEEIHLSGLNPSQQVLVLGRYADGLERDLTGASPLVLGSAEVAAIEDQGRLTALAEGSTTLQAQVANHSATAMLTVQRLKSPPPFSFQHDIGGILTKRGCNDSSCHAGVKGRGGFKLSLNALDPKEDYRWIVKGGTYQVMSLESAGPESPRIDLSQPENSLLLRKPTLLLPHGGGERLTAESSDYRTLLDWIQSGAPYEYDDPAVEVERVTLFPEESVLDAKGTRQVLVTAHLADGRTRDLTHQASYQSSNEEVVTVTDFGRVRARTLGETTLIVRTAGHTVSARFGVISEPLQA